MKKYLSLLLLVPMTVMMFEGIAQAQRKNTTDKDVAPKECVCADDSADCPCRKKMADKMHRDERNKKHKAYKADVDRWIAWRNDEVDDIYKKVMKKIRKADLPEENTKALQKMADANRAFVKNQIVDAAALAGKNHDECLKLAAGYEKICEKMDDLLAGDD
jgi:hypothetical protein